MTKHFKITSLLSVAAILLAGLSDGVSAATEAHSENFNAYTAGTAIGTAENIDTTCTSWTIPETMFAKNDEFSASFANISGNNVLCLEMNGWTSTQGVHRQFGADNRLGEVIYENKFYVPTDVTGFNQGNDKTILKIGLWDNNGWADTVMYEVIRENGIITVAHQPYSSEQSKVISVPFDCAPPHDTWITIKTLYNGFKNTYRTEISYYDTVSEETITVGNWQTSYLSHSYTKNKLSTPEGARYYCTSRPKTLFYIDDIKFDILPAADSTKADVDAITVDSEWNESKTLPIVGSVYQSDIVWESDKPDIISIDASGNATLTPAYIDHNVTLKATAKKYSGQWGGESFRSFIVKVGAIPYRAQALIIGDASRNVADGNMVVSVPLSNTALDKTYDLWLFQIDTSTGKIIDCAKNTSSSGLPLEASLPYADNYEYPFYVMTPEGYSLKNAPPAAVLPDITAVPGRRLNFEWQKAADDFEAVSKYIINENDADIGTVYEQSGITNDPDVVNTFTTSPIDDGLKHTYSIIAYDHLEATSAPKPFTVELAKMFSIDLANFNDSSDGISFVANLDNPDADSYSKVAEKEGVKCIQTIDRSGINGKYATSLYFVMDKNKFDRTEKDIMLEITYFDQGAGNITLQYNADNGNNFEPVDVITLENTSTWKTATVRLTNAQLNGLQSDDADFRILGSGIKEIYISHVAAIASNNYQPKVTY